MENNIFPKEIIEHTSQTHLWKHSVRSQLLYCSTIVAVMAALGALPFIKLDVSVKSRGMIRPQTEMHIVAPAVSGAIKEFYVHENQPVKRGQLLAVIASPVIEEKLSFNRQKQVEISNFIHDLNVAGGIDTVSFFEARMALKTALYSRALLKFQQESRDAFHQYQNARQIFERKKFLFEKAAISKAEFEDSEYQLESAKNKYDFLYKSRLGAWESDLVAYRQELDQLKAEEQQLLEEQQRYNIVAPVSGTLQNVAGISAGTFIQTNQTITEISPDSKLIAECYIPPRDIGLLKEDMAARFQIDAFDYNQWGVLEGTIKEISNDITIVNNQPVFKVRCAIDQNYLSLNNGYKGYLKKGMTLQARFMVARRSLFQLLYDNVDDWLNPVWDKKNSTTERASL